MILVEGLLDLPIAYLIIAPAMGAFDVSLEESSKVCGATNLRTLFKVTLPVLRLRGGLQPHDSLLRRRFPQGLQMNLGNLGHIFTGTFPAALPLISAKRRQSA